MVELRIEGRNMRVEEDIEVWRRRWYELPRIRIASTIRLRDLWDP